MLKVKAKISFKSFALLCWINWKWECPRPAGLSKYHFPLSESLVLFFWNCSWSGEEPYIWCGENNIWNSIESRGSSTHSLGGAGCSKHRPDFVLVFQGHQLGASRRRVPWESLMTSGCYPPRRKSPLPLPDHSRILFFRNLFLALNHLKRMQKFLYQNRNKKNCVRGLRHLDFPVRGCLNPKPEAPAPVPGCFWI